MGPFLPRVTEAVMRTTIEMKPEHRAKLLELAARRGAKGFSDLVAEALEAHLQAEGRREAQRKRAVLYVDRWDP